MRTILLLDNYDSFVHNVARALRELGARVDVMRSDALSVDEAIARDPSHLVISPGPGEPADAGVSVPLVRRLQGRVPVLGICLGHQAIAEAYGGRVISSPAPMHGRASSIVHRGQGILSGLPSPFPAARYHSLSVEEASLPSALEAVAWTADGELMAVRDRMAPVWGLQFHPESILTPVGDRILEAFLRLEAPAPDPAGLATQAAGRRAVGLLEGV
jgi:anthranilate synthase/aminodeoxychorismate synthase-like glutamine amidotransferase